MKRAVCTSSSLAAVLFTLVVQVHAEEPEDATAPLSKKLDYQLKTVYEPVDISGPAITKKYMATEGDLVQLQIKYPLTLQPLPESASVTSSKKIMKPVDVFRTAAEVVMIDHVVEATTPSIGFGYISILVKAEKAGETLIEARIKMSNGAIESRSFNFLVEKKK